MRSINWFDGDPKSPSWLHKMGLKAGDIVRVDGRLYRFSTEAFGREYVLTPVEGKKA